MVVGKFCLALCLMVVAVETLQLDMWTFGTAEVGQ
jgi:hypothetical protein